MASKNQYPSSWLTSKEYGTVPKTENTSRRHQQYPPMSPMFSRRLYSYGSDDADRRVYSRLEQRAPVRQQLPRWMESSIFSGPKLLIYTDKSGHFVISDETLMQISEITWKLVIVGIAGPYRCGKSFLLNRLAGKSKGFFVGNTTDAATKGIWAWCQKHPKREKTVLLLLDTEGLGDIKKGDTDHDNKILTLITLMSNVLVFNMMGRFDEDSIIKLAFASQISESVQFGNAPKKQNTLPSVMPEFVLCLRDFYLTFGDGIHSSDMYFEDCLANVEGRPKYNAPRQSFRTYFPTRHCFTFPLPADAETMTNLENADEKQLCRSFLEKAEQFRQHIFDCKPKRMYDSDLSVRANVDGPIFKDLLEYHANCTNNGIIPDIENAFFTASRKGDEKIIQAVKDDFKKTIKGIELPVDSLKDVNDKVRTSMMKCLKMFRERIKMDKDNKVEKQLQSDLQKMWDDMRTKNSKLLQRQYAENLMKVYTSTFKETKSAFAKENGFQEYKKKLDRMKIYLEKGLDQSLQSEFSLAWSVFQNTIRDDAIEILETNKKLTKEELERQMKEMNDANEKAKKNLMAEQAKLLAETKKTVTKERDEKHKENLKKIQSDLDKFQTLSAWGRTKFLFTGKLGD